MTLMSSSTQWLCIPAGTSKFDSRITKQGRTFTVTLTVPGKYGFY